MPLPTEELHLEWAKIKEHYKNKSPISSSAFAIDFRSGKEKQDLAWPKLHLAAQTIEPASFP
jgi:hypothetical protein